MERGDNKRRAIMVAPMKLSCREIYRRFKRQVKWTLKRRGAFGLNGLNKLIVRGWRIHLKYGIPFGKLADFLTHFIYVFAHSHLVVFVREHPEWVLKKLAIIGQVTAIALLAA